MINKKEFLCLTLILCSLVFPSCNNNDDANLRSNLKEVTNTQVLQNIEKSHNVRISKKMIEDEFENLMKHNSGFYYCTLKNKLILVIGRCPILEPVEKNKPFLIVTPCELYDFRNDEMIFGEEKFIPVFDDKGYVDDITENMIVKNNKVEALRYKDDIYKPLHIDSYYLTHNVSDEMYEALWIPYGEYVPVQQRFRISPTYTQEFRELMKPIFFEKYLDFEKQRAINVIEEVIDDARIDYQNSMKQ